MGRPSRSDEHPPPHVEAQIEVATRDYFDHLAPKRHAKPSRSDPGALLPAGVHIDPAADAPIPELAKFQDLEAHSQKIAWEIDGSAETEEYMATDYYDDLNGMDKHHHTTGSGFIKVEGSNENESSHEMALAAATGLDVNSNNNASQGKGKGNGNGNGNPATNDWIPASAQTHTVSQRSTKPQRSDN